MRTSKPALSRSPESFDASG